MPLTLSNLRSVVAQVTRGGGRSVIASRRNFSTTSRRRHLSSTSRRRKRYYSGSIADSGVSCDNAFIAGLCSVVVWKNIQLFEYLRTVHRDAEKQTGLESQTAGNVLREAWKLLYRNSNRRDVAQFGGFLVIFFCVIKFGGQ